MRPDVFASLALLCASLAPTKPTPQTEADEYTRYELLAPDSARFRILYEVSATTPGASVYFNPIRISLPRPVPKDGEVRLLIDKTYRDPKSYFVEGERIVFSRALGIKRNAVVLPKGYELISCNVPSQVLTEADGRILVSFMNPFPSDAALVVKARRLP